MGYSGDTMNKGVFIDGVKYVPVNEINETQIQAMRKVLESQKYLSSSAIDEIINALKGSSETSEVEIEKPEKVATWKGNHLRGDDPFKYGATHKVLFNISGFLSNGSILYKKRRSPAKWNIQQAMVIRDAMNDDSSKGMTFKDATELESKTKLSKTIVRKIMYNIEFGTLSKTIDEWKVKFNQKHLQGFRPVENNPQKRRESGGLYG